MKQFRCSNLLLLVLLLGATVAVACGGEDATQIPPATGPTATLAPTETPGPAVTPQATATPTTASPLSPEDTVRTFFDAIGAEDSEKMAGLLIPERAVVAGYEVESPI